MSFRDSRSIQLFHPIIVFALPMLLVLGGAAQETRQLSVEPIDVSKIQPLSPEQVSDRVRELSETARCYQEACEEFDSEFDGSPHAAGKIALLKLKMLENASLAITVSSGAIENFRCTALLQRSRNSADQEAIDSEINQVDSEVNRLADKVQLRGDRLEGDSAEMLLMVKKLERLQELREDATAIRRSQRAIDQTLANLRSLNNSIRIFSVLMQEEVKRQSTAINSNRIARQSTVISNQAERLYASIRTLSPVVDSLNKQHQARAVTPSVVPPMLPEDLRLTLTPEMLHQLRNYISKRVENPERRAPRDRPTNLQVGR